MNAHGRTCLGIFFDDHDEAEDQEVCYVWSCPGVTHTHIQRIKGRPCAVGKDWRWLNTPAQSHYPTEKIKP